MQSEDKGAAVFIISIFNTFNEVIVSCYKHTHKNTLPGLYMRQIKAIPTSVLAKISKYKDIKTLVVPS